MIDRRRRDQFAELLRHFAAGRLTNDEFKERLDEILDDPHSVSEWDDRALWAVRERAWFLYDDTHTHRLMLPREGRREVARWILFLYSDFEYEWLMKSFISLSSCLLNLLTLGWWGRSQVRHFRAMGDWDVWPFIRRADFEEACRRPHLFGSAPA
jgi:hypothetical protein